MAEVFDRSAVYYDLLYQDKNYLAEAEYIAAVLRAAAPGANNVLEFGAGTGKHGRLLAGHGFRVVGVEASEAMVLASSNQGEALSAGSFRYEVGDIRSHRLKSRFDAVISIFHVVSYQTSSTDLFATFENAAHHLKPNGIFFFDVWHGPAVLSQRPEVRVKRAENDSVRLLRLAEPLLNAETHIVNVTLTLFAEVRRDGTIHCFEEHHQMRYLFPDEIEMLAEESGFIVEKSEEFLTGVAPSEQTWGVAYLLRKSE